MLKAAGRDFSRRCCGFPRLPRHYAIPPPALAAPPAPPPTSARMSSSAQALGTHIVSLVNREIPTQALQMRAEGEPGNRAGHGRPQGLSPLSLSLSCQMNSVVNKEQGRELSCRRSWVGR